MTTLRAMAEYVSYCLWLRGVEIPPAYWMDCLDGGRRASQFFGLWWSFTGVRGFAPDGTVIR
jgi:hypothetical protein